MPFVSSGRNVQVPRLDSGSISPQHEWDVNAQTDISFLHIVEESLEPRADAQRFKLLASVSVQAAQVAFATMCRSTTLFKVPARIQCDRNFARDAEEAHYLDAMDAYLCRPPGPLKVEDLPFLKSPLRSRYFNSFSMRPNYFNEFYDRRRTGAWIPYSPDISHFSDTELASWFPQEEEWVREISQPTSLPVPVPPSIYYYHRELRAAQLNPVLMNINRIIRLKFAAEHEYYMSYLAMWWNEVFFRGKAFVLTPHSIDVLHEHCGQLRDIVEKPAQAILERMRMFADMPTHYDNWMCFNDRSLENVTFIFAVREKGVHDHTIKSGRRLWCRRNHRSVTTTRYNGSTFRRIPLMDQRVTGLIGLVAEQRWTAYTSLRVSDLLHLLVGLEKSSSSQLRECGHELSMEKFAHDTTRRRTRELDERVSSLRKELQDTHRRHDDANRHIAVLDANLRRWKSEVARLDRENGEKQQRIIATQQRLREEYYNPVRPQVASGSQVLRSTFNSSTTDAMISRSQVVHPARVRHGTLITPNSSSKSVPSSPSYSPLRKPERPATPGTAKQGEKPTLRKIRPGYPFHSMLRSTESLSRSHPPQSAGSAQKKNTPQRGRSE